MESRAGAIVLRTTPDLSVHPEPLAPVRAVYKASMATRRTMAGGSGRVAASDEK